MSNSKPVVSRTESGRYRLQLSQQQSLILATMLESASSKRAKANYHWPHFTTVIMMGVLTRLYRRTARKLIDAPAKGVGVTLGIDELASLGEVLSELRQIEGLELITMLFAPIHQILS